MTPLQVFGLMVAFGLYSGVIMILGFRLGRVNRAILQREAHFRGFHEAMINAAQEAERLARNRLGVHDHRGAVVARELRCLCEAHARDARREFTDTRPSHGGSAPGV